MNYSIDKRVSQWLLIAAVFFLFFPSSTEAQGGGQYSREELERLIDETIEEVNGYITDLNQSIREARNNGADALAARLDELLILVKKELQLLIELKKDIPRLSEQSIDQKLKKISQLTQYIRDVQMNGVTGEMQSLLKWVFGKKDRALREAIIVAKRKQQELTQRIIELNGIISGTIEPLPASPKPEPKLEPKPPPPKPESKPKPPPPSPEPEPELPPETTNGWQPLRPPQEKPQPGYIWLYDKVWRQAPNWVYEDGRLVKKDPPPGSYLYIDPQGNIQRANNYGRSPKSPPAPSPPPFSGDGNVQEVVCRRYGSWFYCDNKRTGRPVVKYQVGGGQISSFIENQLKQDPNTVFFYDPDQNQIVGVERQERPVLIEEKRQSSPPPRRGEPERPPFRVYPNK